MSRTADSLRQRVLDAPNQLISALSKGEDALLRFDKDWNALISQLNSAIQMSALDEDLIQLVRMVSSQVAALGASLLDLNDTADKTSSQLGDAIMLMDVSGEDTSGYTAESEFSAMPPACIIPAYTWLLRNLHNPYPSRAVRKTLAHQAGVTAFEIKEWFREVRRHVGWIDLCRNRFSSSRVFIVNAATQALVAEDPSHPLPIELQVEFLTLQGRIENLYRRTSTESKKSPRRHEPLHPSDSPTLTPVSPSRLPGVLDVSKTESSLRLSKLPRTHHHSDDIPALIPSSSSPLTEGTALLHNQSPREGESSAIQVNAEPTMIRPRKRRLSDAESRPLQKRPRGLPVGPRLQTVSDPFPRSNAPDSSALDSVWREAFSIVPQHTLSLELASSERVVIETKSWDTPVDEGYTPEMAEFVHFMKTSSAEPIALPLPLTPSLESAEPLEPALSIPSVDSQSIGLPHFSDATLSLDGTVIPDDLLTSFTSSQSFSEGSSTASSTPPMTPPPLTPTDATSSPQPLFDLDRSHFSEVLTQTNAEPAVVLPEDHSLVDEYFNLDAYENDCASSHTPSKLKDLSTRDSLTFDLAYPLPAFDWNGYPSLIGFGDAIGFASQPLTITA